METFIKDARYRASRARGQVTVDDAVMVIGRFENGALATLEATRFALAARTASKLKSRQQRLARFRFRDMNRLKYYTRPTRTTRLGDILGHARPGCIPYVRIGGRPGHIIGYEQPFVHTIADFINAVQTNVLFNRHLRTASRHSWCSMPLRSPRKNHRWIVLGK